jgi:hypothetical protein
MMWLGKKKDEISVSGKRDLVPVGLEVKVKPKLPSCPTTLSWRPTGLNGTTGLSMLTANCHHMKGRPRTELYHKM